MGNECLPFFNFYVSIYRELHFFSFFLLGSRQTRREIWDQICLSWIQSGIYASKRHQPRIHQEFFKQGRCPHSGSTIACTRRRKDDTHCTKLNSGVFFFFPTPPPDHSYYFPKLCAYVNLIKPAISFSTFSSQCLCTKTKMVFVRKIET